MPLEAATYIEDLVATNPLSSDQVGQGDDHLRLIKSTLRNSLPNLGARIGNVTSVNLGYTVLSTDNTARLAVPAATVGTISHTISLPDVASITAGFFFDVHLIGSTDVVSLVATGAGTIEGATSYAGGPKSAIRVYYAGSNAWRVEEKPCYGATGGGLFIDGPLTISGAVHMNGTLSLSGAARLMSDVSISGALFVGGNTSLGTLTVSGVAHFKSSVSIAGAATVDSNITVGGRLTVSGTTVLQGDTHIAGGISVSGIAILTGAARLGSTLSVSGTAVLGSDVNITGGLSVASTTMLTGAVNMGSAVTISGVATLLSGLTVSGLAVMTTLQVNGGALFSSTVTISGTCVLAGGQLKFPATQNASADANTLDDYEEGTWTPVLTFATAGNLVVVYSIQTGVYTKIGRQANVQFLIRTSTFTHTTASGTLQITGFPFTSSATTTGPTNWRGVTKANFTDMSSRLDSGTATGNIMASGSGQVTAVLTAADMPTGGTVEFFGQVTHYV